MIYPHPLFAFREWGTQIAAGQTCPSCTKGKLKQYEVCPHCLGAVFVEDKAGDYVPQCPRCASAFKIELSDIKPLACDNPNCSHYTKSCYVRKYFAQSLPPTLGGVSTSNAIPIFASVQNYLQPNPDEDPLHFADFVLDIDREYFNDALQVLLGVTNSFDYVGAPYQVYFSGNKGFHVIVPAQAIGAKPHTTLNTVMYRKFAEYLTEHLHIEFDPAIYSHARMFREPLTVHGKSGLYKVPLLPHEYGDALRIAADPSSLKRPTHFLTASAPEIHPTLNTWFNQAQERNLNSEVVAEVTANYKTREVAHTQYGGIGEQLPCITAALEDGPPMPGTRNKLYKIMAGYFLAQGEDEAAMLDWAKNVPGASSAKLSERIQGAKSTFRWAARRKYEFDCRDMRELGLCNPNCPLLAMTGIYDPIITNITNQSANIEA